MPIAKVQLPDGRIGRFEVKEGTTPEEVTAFAEQHLAQPSGESAKAPQAESSTGGALRRGIEQGVTANLGDEIKASIGALYAKAFGGDSTKDLTVGELTNMANEDQKKQLQADFQQHPVATISGNVAGTVLTGAGIAATKAGSAVANSLRSGGAGARIVKGVAAGSTSGTVYGAGAADNEHRAEGATEGAIYGGVAGGAIPAVGAVVKGAKSAIVPKVAESVASLAQRARDFGIDLRLDQISPSRARNTVQKVSQELPFSGVDNFEQKQERQWLTGVAKTIGQDADNLGPDVINKFAVDNGAKFAQGIGKNPIQFNDIALSRFDDISQKAKKFISKDLYQIVKTNVDDFKANVSGGQIDPNKLASYRSELVKDIPNASGESKKYLSQIVETIDDITESQLPQDAADAVKQARREYRNFKTIEPLLEGATDGRINPTALLNRVKASPYIKASKSAVGDDDLVDLARIGKEFLPKKGGSDTFQKSAYALTGKSALTGAATGAAAVGNLGLTAAGLTANRVFQKSVNQSQRLVDAAINSGSKTAKPNVTNPLLNAASGAIGATEKTRPLQIDIPRDTTKPYVPNESIPPAPAESVSPRSEAQPDQLLNKIAQAESGGNPNAKAKTSSASGLFQFTNQTWNSIVGKYGDQLGIKYADKNDPQAQTKAAQKLAEDNTDYLLSKLGRKPSDGEIYIAHFLGAPKAGRLISRKDSNQVAANIFPKEAKANKAVFYSNGKPRTVAEVYQLLTNKVA